MTEPPAKRRRLDMTETFVVCAGKEAKESIVYKNIATQSSKFLQAAFNHDWKKAREKRLMLPDTTSYVFEGYLQWLSTGHITLRSLDSNDWRHYVDFFVLGDFLDDLNFRNAAMDCIIKSHLEDNLGPGRKTIKLTREHTPPGLPLHTLMLQIWSACSTEFVVGVFFKVHEHGVQHPLEFIGDYFHHVGLANQQMPKVARTKLMEEFKTKLSADEVDVLQQ